MTLALILLAVAGLAYANGANDNFKGVATLFGSGTTDYRRALAWATFTTLLGSLTAVLLAGELLKSFSGRGLVADALVNDPRYVAAVALGAGLTVLLATRIGMPVSTTHGLVGGLVGAGWAAGSPVHLPKLASAFFAPLLLSPVLAITATVLLYSVLHRLRMRLGVTEETCFCIGSEPVEVVPLLGPAAALQRAEHLTATVGTTVTCRRRYGGRLLGLQASGVLNGLHYLSAGVVSYARGLNDTPKIAALLLLVPHLSGLGSTILVGLVIAAGGLLNARRVAETMSHKITPLNHGQGLTANLLTGVIVIGASRLGLPVSTTHVSCGALFGIGAVTRQAEWGTIAKILVAWVTTLPTGAALGAIGFELLRRF
jgi:inorganic phosphate transporter, PiT family